MKTNIVVDISPPILYLASYGPKCCQPIKLQDSLKCIILRRKWIMKFIFGMQINTEVFYKLILSIWVFVTRYVQRTQNKFLYLCNIPRKAWDEVDSLPGDKRESFLQLYSITLGVYSQACPKYPKQQVYNIFAIS